MAPELPRIYLLSTHLQPDEVRGFKEAVPSLTGDAREADVVVGRISKRERALFELRRLRLNTEDVHGDRGEAARGDVVKVVRLAWLTDCLKEDAPLPMDDYLVYQGRKKPSESQMGAGVQGRDMERRARKNLFRRPRQGPASAAGKLGTAGQNAEEPVVVSSSSSPSRSRSPSSEEREQEDGPPPLPAYLHTPYSCQRPSPRDPPNDAFIEQLKEMRTLRILQKDEIGARAYSTAIAALAAYPYRIQSLKGNPPIEITRLPGCSSKIAELYQQWVIAGRTRELRDAENDPRMKVLHEFYSISGIGATTAIEFYNKGWRDTDDIVTHGWGSLSRAQQIGIKYHDDFQLKISRAEVERIAGVVLSRARRIHPDFQMMIVGGYRRGKEENNDVDVVLSHRDEQQTLHVIQALIEALEADRYIVRTLSLSSQASDRGQTPSASKGPGHSPGFDTLDKALVVWRDPDGSPSSETGAVPHRRVDIIISPWKTVGCAVLGWSGATTFERDLRQYCKKEKGWRFDSSGIRSRRDGAWVDVEGGPDGPAPDMETAERRVLAAMGLAWREPTERCTG
ncbi:DNA polymerase type-X family protein pol4 [Escovopsis weberi]|uniref:DNA polymerase n=1 Tax=Escovopsis weberi TaxID=150374 RepID=A0A0M8N0I3_ESCWE|nr:DNA polymerase type-X family protein pol4 [Escovopsis weberi]